MSLKYYIFYYHESIHFYRIREEGGSGCAPYQGSIYWGWGEASPQTSQLPPQKTFSGKKFKAISNKDLF